MKLGLRRRDERRVPRRAWLRVAALGLLLCAARSAPAVEPADSLRQGQYLVDRATGEIDRRLALVPPAADRATLYEAIRDLLAWEQDYALNRIAPAYALDGPHGLLVRDGIADTIATRLHDPLGTYAERETRELLTPGRQAFELGAAGMPMPPGRFLGFHLVHLAGLYGAQCDSIAAVVERTGKGDLEGMQDGYLRHLRDLAHLYAQAHATSSDKYLCRISQEDWIGERLACPECGRRGMRLADQRMALREDMTGTCGELLYSQSDDQATRVAGILCRRWGHIFDARCRQEGCGGSYEFSVPLPYYRRMQLEILLGELEEPDIEELIRRF